MNIPKWLKPCVFGALVGAAAITFVGFSWGGWVTGGSADKMAMNLSQDNVLAALLPVCLDIAQTDPDRATNLKTIRDAASHKQRDAVMAAGWATVPGTDGPNRDLAQACLASLDLGTS